MCAICRKNHFPEKNLILQRKNTIRFAVTVAVTSIRALVCVLAVVINKMNRTTSGFVYIKREDMQEQKMKAFLLKYRSSLLLLQ